MYSDVGQYWRVCVRVCAFVMRTCHVEMEMKPTDAYKHLGVS